MEPGYEEEVRRRLADVRRRIAAAAGRAGRDPASVGLVIVTKGQPVARLRAVLGEGPRCFGENRVEEALPKIDALGSPALSWHLIGPLQSRKVRLVADHFELIHAVDRLKVARLLDATAAALGRRQAVLLEWNVSGEATKAGWQVADREGDAHSLEDVRQILSLSNLEVRGLMTVGPLSGDAEVQRKAFRRLAAMRERLARTLGCALPELSMGMSDDFETAVEEGATLVRIGRAILGERM